MPKVEGSHDGPLECPSCKEYMVLVFKKIGYTGTNKGIGCNLPFLKCGKCNQIIPIIPEEEMKEVAKKQLAEIPEGYFKIPLRGEDKKFEKYESLEFKYDGRDYYYIPGLWRPWNEGFLTPVFFDTGLLLHYNNHPDYRVALNSFSNVTIYKKGEPLLPGGMGINQNGNLFAWLGDLFEVFSDGKCKGDLYRFLGSNVDSDHDVGSDYYANQIEANWTTPDNEVQIFSLKDKFEKFVLEKYKFKIYKLKIANLSEVYKSPVMDEKEQIVSSYVKLNNFLDENIER